LLNRRVEFPKCKVARQALSGASDKCHPSLRALFLRERHPKADVVVAGTGLEQAVSGTTEIRFEMPAAASNHAGRAAFSPDGKLVVSASGPQYDTRGRFKAASDHSVRIWNAESGEERQVFPCEKPQSGVAFAHDGQMAFSAGAEP
jgi:WD40 repeat protein